MQTRIGQAIKNKLTHDNKTTNKTNSVTVESFHYDDDEELSVRERTLRTVTRMSDMLKSVHTNISSSRSNKIKNGGVTFTDLKLSHKNDERLQTVTRRSFSPPKPPRRAFAYAQL